MSLAVAVTSQYSDKPKFGQVAPLNCESILSGTAIKVYLPKQDIFFEGDAKQSIYRIESGAVCLYKTMADGRRQIFDFAFPGDLIGLGASHSYSCSAQAIGSASLKSIPLARVYQLAARDPGFALELYEAVSTQLEATRELLMTLGQQSAIERVSIFILRLSQRNAKNGKNPNLLNIPMTRSDIADLLGTTIETVSRSLTKLRQEKVIDIIRNSLIQIIDMDGLKALAGQVNYH
jgi:CRP/FNR family transcriptional regulator, anaerobic regulatory protein